MIEAVRSEMAAVRQLLSGEDTGAIRTATEALSAKIYDLAAAMHRAASEEKREG
jgi:hypothetical protein